MRPKLSFCIPTFNRADLVEECVSELLRYKGDDVEIIVSDNASPDDTRERILGFKDKRIKYFRNETNVFSLNLGRAVTRGTGDFLFLLSDEDRVVVDSIPEILACIERNPDASMIFGTIKGTYNYEYGDRIYKKGVEALRKFGFCSHRYMYCTGIIYNSKYIERGAHYFGEMGPHVFLSTDMCLKGDVATIYDTIAKIDNRRLNVDYGFDKLVEKHKREYSLESMLTFYKRFLAFLDHDILRQEGADKLIVSLFFEMVYWCVWDRVYQVKDYTYRQFYGFSPELDFDPYKDLESAVSIYLNDLEELIIPSMPHISNGVKNVLTQTLVAIKHFYYNFYRAKDVYKLFGMINETGDSETRNLVEMNLNKAVGYAVRFGLPMADKEFEKHNRKAAVYMSDYFQKRYEAVLNLVDDSIEANYSKGLVYAALKEYEKSNVHFHKYLSLMDEQSRFYRICAFDYMLKAKYTIAKNYLSCDDKKNAIRYFRATDSFSREKFSESHYKSYKMIKMIEEFSL